jgi:hypothetical protein
MCDGAKARLKRSLAVALVVLVLLAAAATSTAAAAPTVSAWLNLAEPQLRSAPQPSVAAANAEPGTDAHPHTSLGRTSSGGWERSGEQFSTGVVLPRAEPWPSGCPCLPTCRQRETAGRSRPLSHGEAREEG